MSNTVSIRPQTSPAWSADKALRFPAAVFLYAAAGVHLPLIREHLHEAPYIGWLFIALAVTAAALATALLLRDSLVLWLLTAAASASAITAYVLSRSVGLPQIPDDIGDWSDPRGVAALAVESAALVLAVGALSAQVRRGPRRSAGPLP